MTGLPLYITSPSLVQHIPGPAAAREPSRQTAWTAYRLGKILCTFAAPGIESRTPATHPDSLDAQRWAYQRAVALTGHANQAILSKRRIRRGGHDRFMEKR
jgi:hypothetical protein